MFVERKTDVTDFPHYLMKQMEIKQENLNRITGMNHVIL